MIRRSLWVALLAILALPVLAGGDEKGQFDLFLNGVKKGYEKYRIERSPKESLWSVSSEIRFQLPMPKAKRSYVDLKLYPTADFDLTSRRFVAYYYRMTFDDFSKAEMVESQNSATEFIDQDTRTYDLANRSAQLNQDEMADRIDLGVNAGKVVVRGQTLSFKQTRFSASRLKDEPLPDNPAVLDAYAFCLYLPLAQRALAMKGESEPLSVVFPQGMRLRQGSLQYMGIEKTPFHGKIYILRHYDVNVGEGTLSSFWLDKAGKLVQVAVPTDGLVASLTKYEPKAFEREEPRVFKESVAVAGAFVERATRIASGPISLGATLTLPAETGSFPTVLLVNDLQALDRDGNDPSNPYSRAGAWKQVAYLLAAEGFASLRCDSRGVGESGGLADKVTWPDRTGDVVALTAWLKSQPTTKDQKVIFASLGLAGWVAADASSKAQPSAMVAIAYPAKGLLRLWREQANSLSDPESRLSAQNELEQLMAKLEDRGATESTYGGKKISLPEVREMAEKDPLALAGALSMPCLFVYPERNQTVIAFHKDVLAPALHSGQEVVVLPGIGHRLTAYDAEGAASGIVEAKNLAPIFSWIKKVK